METIAIILTIALCTFFIIYHQNQIYKKMSPELTRLTASVTNLKTVDESLVALVGNLASAIRNNADDPAALNALADSLDAEASNVSAAVTANTPAA